VRGLWGSSVRSGHGRAIDHEETVFGGHRSQGDPGDR
jgi:hypothetical protein